MVQIQKARTDANGKTELPTTQERQNTKDRQKKRDIRQKPRHIDRQTCKYVDERKNTQIDIGQKKGKNG